MTKDYDKLLGRDDTEKVLVDVTNYFVSMKPIRTLQTIKVFESVAYSCNYVINKISYKFL